MIAGRRRRRTRARCRASASSITTASTDTVRAMTKVACWIGVLGNGSRQDSRGLGARGAALARGAEQADAIERERRTAPTFRARSSRARCVRRMISRARSAASRWCCPRADARPAREPRARDAILPRRRSILSATKGSRTAPSSWCAGSSRTACRRRSTSSSRIWRASFAKEVAQGMPPPSSSRPRRERLGAGTVDPRHRSAPRVHDRRRDRHRARRLASRT